MFPYRLKGFKAAMIGYIVKKFIGSKNEREVKRLRPLVTKINAFEAELQKLPDEALSQKTAAWKEELSKIQDIEELKRRLIVLSERAGTRVRGVYKWHLSEKSKKANAALTGLGATRRIILADTLLDSYSDDEIEAVLAHELGHHVHRHILKSIFVQAGITLFGFWLANEVLSYAVERRNMFETMSDFANLPLLILVSTVLSFLLMPALNAYSRFNERQADRYCFQSVASVEPFISAMNKLAEQNLAEKTPSRWVEWFLHSHPAIAKRVAAAEAWAKSH